MNKNKIIWIQLLIFGQLFAGCTDRKSPHTLFVDTIEFSFENLPYHDIDVVDVATNSKGEIFMCDFRNRRVLCFSSTGEFVEEIGSRDKYSSDIPYPYSVTTSKDDKIYIGYWDRVKILDRDRKEVSDFQVGMLPSPMVIDSLGNLYIGRFKSGKVIHKFDTQGRLLKSFGEPYHHANPGIQQMYSTGSLALVDDKLYYSCLVPYRVDVFDLNGNLAVQLERPDLDFQPQTSSEGYNLPHSKGLGICSSNDLVLVSFHILGAGNYIDFYRRHHNSFHLRDMHWSGYLLGSDDNGNIYYRPDLNPGSSVFRGKLIPTKEIQH